MRMKILKVRIRKKPFRLFVPEYTIDDDLWHKITKPKSNHRMAVNPQGAPDLYQFKQEQEESLFLDDGLDPDLDHQQSKEKKGFFSFLSKLRKSNSDEPIELENDINTLYSQTVILDSLNFCELSGCNSSIHILVDKSPYPIGRMLDQLQDIDYISYCHGVIYAPDYQHVYFGDCSTNLNYINDDQLEHYKYYELKDGDTLKLGDLVFEVKGINAEASNG